MSQLENVWIVSENSSRLPELIAGGLQLGKKVSAFILGTQSDVDFAFSYGAGTVYQLGEQKAEVIIEDYAQTIARTISKAGLSALILLPATKSGKALAAKLGVLLKAGVINDASDIAVTENGINAKHMVYGGLALGEEVIKSKMAILTVGSGVFESGVADNSKTGETITVEFIKPKVMITCLERREKHGLRVDLGKAKRVVGIGRGIAAQDDIKMIEELCRAAGAELGCTRPIAEGEKWMERDRYIGVSGVMLKPDVYLALGVSGQIQHMVGVNGSQSIFAVNKDKNAPIFQYVDYGLVGDIYKVVPALIKALG